MNSNSDNSKVGKTFQLAVKEWFEQARKVSYQMEKAIPIGTPGKNHKFDLVEATGNVVVECKCYAWTETGNVPSAKIRTINEAAFFLSFLPDTMEKIIVMAKATHPKRKETLAGYYHRSYGHLLGATRVMEYDVSTKTMRNIGGNP